MTVPTLFMKITLCFKERLTLYVKQVTYSKRLEPAKRIYMVFTLYFKGGFKFIRFYTL